MVRARRRGQQLQLIKLSGAARERALALAAGYIASAKDCVGESRDQFNSCCAGVPAQARDRRLAAGLRKLVQDRCEFETEPEISPVELRRILFAQASAERRELPGQQRLDREPLVAAVADQLGMAVSRLEQLLFADLRQAQRLLSFDGLSAQALVDHYQLAQAQAVLLRAVRVVVDVRCARATGYRYLFGKLKFLRLLHEMRALQGGGYRLLIDGPYNLLRSTTKYGLQLALLLPAIAACQWWRLEADLRWGRDRQRLTFRLDGEQWQGPRVSPRQVERPSEVQRLLDRFADGKSSWFARPSGAILSLPGIGLCVPDLVFEQRETGYKIQLEVLGYWSREAVWRRVDLVQAGLEQPILFAVSERLRVSEDVLGNDLPSALYVYKGVISAAAIEQKLNALVQRGVTVHRDGSHLTPAT